MAVWPKWMKRGRGPAVRPWALAGPVVILLICLPLLRPLWSPGHVSARETVALESAQTLLRTHQFALTSERDLPPEAIVEVRGKLISRDPPLFTVIIAAGAWVLGRCGVTFENNPQLLDYLLTLLIATLPTALGCGLIYRLGRAFDLTRPWRVALALTCVLASGWVSFAVVLLPHALAISLVIGAITAFVHVSRAPRFARSSGWLVVAGACAALAGALDPLSLWVMPVILIGAAWLGRTWRGAAGGMLLIALGAALPIVAYVVTARAATGDLLPPRWHTTTFASPTPTVLSTIGDDTNPVDVSIWVIIGRAINRLLIFTVGAHGVLSHFPVLVIALAGAGTVLRRHWAPPLKWLAGGMLAALVLLLAYKMVVRVDDIDLDFAAPRLIVIVPAMMIWAGSWVRRRHAPAVWAAAGTALAVSVAISLLGATAPAPPGGYAHYTAAEAAARLLSQPSAVADHH